MNCFYMIIDAHVHVYRGQSIRDSSGKRSPPQKFVWDPSAISHEEYVEIGKRKYELGKVVLLDPPETVFCLKEIFKDYIIPVPLVNMDETAPEELDVLFSKGAVGIKFLAPEKSYGDDSYFPLYDVIASNHGLAVFHTGFVLAGRFEPGCWDARKRVIDITNMRPAALDRVARAFPKLKILMAHFGNPWWEEAWKITSSHKNIYADLSGGTAFGRSLEMWKEIFSPNGVLDTCTVSKLCFGTDSQCFIPGRYGHQAIYEFYERLTDALKLTGELRERIYSGNILELTGIRG